tara:strand:- start:818 stop:1696 length:879 start_codon:yes stop_codon:yes gene_type:complete
MSNELSTMMAGSDLAAAMGFNVDTTEIPSGPKLARLSQLVMAPIMKEVVDEEGDLEEKVVVPQGSYKLVDADGNTVYSKSVTIRLFAQRQQWTQYDTGSNFMHKTVMATVLKGDLKDTKGTFNLGRPNKYVKDWEALDDDTKTLMRSVRNTKVLFGKVQLNKAIDENGVAVEGYESEIDFTMGVTSPDSKRALDEVLKGIVAKKLLPIEHTIKLTSQKNTGKNGNKFAVIVAALGTKTKMLPEDHATVQAFVDYIDYGNEYVLSKWKSLRKPDVQVDPATLDAIVQVEEIPF